MVEINLNLNYNKRDINFVIAQLHSGKFRIQRFGRCRGAKISSIINYGLYDRGFRGERTKTSEVCTNFECWIDATMTKFMGAIRSERQICNFKIHPKERIFANVTVSK